MKSALAAKFVVLARRQRSVLALSLVSLFGFLAFMALHRILVEVRFHEVRTSLQAITAWQWSAAASFTAGSYLLLTLYDVFALQTVGEQLPWRVAAFASFTSYTLSHSLGFSLITGGSARYRIYSANGLGTADIVRIIALTGIAFWIGVGLIASCALIVEAGPFALGPLSLTPAAHHLLGYGLVTAMAVLLWMGRNGTLHIFGWSLPLPTGRLALFQIIAACSDIVVASAALYVLLPHADAALFPLFLAGYATALIAGSLAHVPGGFGIFEAVMFATLPGIGRPELLAALVAYRVIYYLMPLLLAGTLLAIREHGLWSKPVGLALSATQSVVTGLAPMILSALVFAGGTVLLISGSLPALNPRLDALGLLLPLPFVEASHIAASLSGTGLILLAPGLYTRLDSAFLLTRTLLIAGAIFSIAKGFDYEEAVILLAIAGILQWSKQAFYRHTAFTVRTFTPGWIAAFIAAIALSSWVGLFAYKHVSYQQELWWEFAWKGDASRFLRAEFAAAITVLGVIVVWFFRPAVNPVCEQPQPLPLGSTALDLSERTDAMLALTGDKLFIHSASGQAFLMYQIQGRTWIVMGDPVGLQSEWPELLWQIRERADRARSRLLLYQLSQAALPIAIDLGMQLVKYGEEARVDLAAFSLAGPEVKSLRYSVRRAEREGATFGIIPALQVPAAMPELRRVSDAWLRSKGQSEKAFSIGRFDPGYLAQFDCAVIRHADRVVAFANIWKTATHQEISVDLMRTCEGVPYGTMDLLFVRLMEWGAQHGYRRFNLGIAPLSGIEARRLAPVWSQAGAFIYKHGDAFYGFEGLRAYKEKFLPLWEPRFVAGPFGFGFPRSMIDLQTLIAGGRGSAARQTELFLAA